MIWLKLFFVLFYCSDFITLGQSTKLSKIKLTTRSGFSCGGWALFAQICPLDLQNCCEEQIVSNPGQGFSGGDTIIKDLKRCNNFTMPIPYGNNFQIRFTSYEETMVIFYLWIAWPFIPKWNGKADYALINYVIRNYLFFRNKQRKVFAP